MSIGKTINQLRTNRNMSQEQFANMFGVSQQSVQKWESDESVPELNKLIKISQQFDISLDALVLDHDARVVEEKRKTAEIKPQYTAIHDWQFYSSNLMIEYEQSMDEGLDIEQYKEVFSSVSRLPKGEIKKKFGDILFDVVTNAERRKDYKYIEPSELEAIKALRKEYTYAKKSGADLKSRVTGAWYGRICGCLLGRAVEGCRTDELVPFLKDTGNYPMHRYIVRADMKDEICSKYKFGFAGRGTADEFDGMPVDDDTNYTVLYQEVIERYGKKFGPGNCAYSWIKLQSKEAYCTAERVAFCNFVNGFQPPESAVYKNPYREWIGAQIRADYFGYINPGNPELAAEMAFRDGCISHIKNGIYGEMFVAAMLAVAAETDNMKDIVLGGLAQVPSTSRLYEDVMSVVDGYDNGVSQGDCFKNIHKKYDEHNGHGWCHTISNAMIVAASLLYGGGDYGRSVCMSVETGFDTDCNGATVGSVFGMAHGIENIDSYWTESLHDTLHTTIFGVDTVKISDRVQMTLKHIEME